MFYIYIYAHMAIYVLIRPHTYTSLHLSLLDAPEAANVYSSSTQEVLGSHVCQRSD